MAEQLTPMLKQYKEIKEQYKDCILFFRMGDFYEMFFDDAKIASKILGIVLTSRGTYDGGKKVPMCGIPYHSAKSYIGKLINSGFKVAICEQVEDPKKAKGLVKREVVRVITPGSVLDEAEVDEKSNLYIAAAVTGKKGYGLSYMDLSTGEFRYTELSSLEELLNELNRISPAELLVLHGDQLLSCRQIEGYRIEIIKEKIDREYAEDLLRKQFQVRSIDGFGFHEMPNGMISSAMIIHLSLIHI